MTSAPAAPAPFSSLQTSKWELGVSLILNFWGPLKDAVACGWGGADSSDKRDWLCGTIADMWVNAPETDDYDVEATLLQVMEDEFDVNLEDDSAFETARQIIALRKEIIDEKYDSVEVLHQRFLAMPRNAARPQVLEVDHDTSDEEEDEEGSGDEEMGDAPPRERAEPVVDEDGFELVQKGRRR